MFIKKNDNRPVRVIREKLGMSQAVFWAHLGVTQSGGSRYETGRTIPRPIEMLIDLVYGKNGERMLRKLRRGIQ